MQSRRTSGQRRAQETLPRNLARPSMSILTLDAIVKRRGWPGSVRYIARRYSYDGALDADREIPTTRPRHSRYPLPSLPRRRE